MTRKPSRTPPSPPRATHDEDVATAFNLDVIEGKLDAKAVKKVGRAIDKDPRASVSVLRRWMEEGR